MMLKELINKLNGKVLILGIGDTLRSDDAIGSVLAKSLKDRIKAKVLDAETNPENFLGRIQKENPDTLIIIDAADFGGEAGEIKVFNPDQLLTANLFSTHNSSLSLLINFLQAYLKSQIIFLAIHPKQIGFQEGLSRELEAARKKLEEFFCNNLG